MRGEKDARSESLIKGARDLFGTLSPSRGEGRVRGWQTEGEERVRVWYDAVLAGRL
jgi:hypothetical protein